MNYKEIKFNVLVIIVISIIYSLNNIALKQYIVYENIRLFCICYLNDIMCPSVLLASINIFIEIIRELVRGTIYFKVFDLEKKFLNSLLGNLLCCLCAGVYWEYIYQYGVKDNIDMICYIFGGIMYYILRNLNKKKPNKKYLFRYKL